MWNPVQVENESIRNPGPLEMRVSELDGRIKISF